MKKNKLFKFKNPICLQGDLEKKDYFEGWYYKCVDVNKDYTCSIIPGISTSGQPYKRHAFIQFVDNTGNLPLYIPYTIRSFTYSDEPFIINIGNCIFSKTRIIINIEHKDYEIKGKITFGEFTDIDRSPLTPTIMGYYRYIPFMECFHSIISLHHTLKGYLKVNNRLIDFNNGIGYLEKDFGTSFPKQWVWIHSNTFTNNNVALMCSVASIPFIKRTFTGLICVLYIDGTEYRFATYKNGDIKKLQCSKNKISIVLEQNEYTLHIKTLCDDGSILIAPKNGDMNRKIIESMSAKVKVTLFHNDRIIYEDISYNGCVEFN